jgi:hypothetical protein
MFISFFLINLAFFWASGAAQMKLHKIQYHLGRRYWLVGVASGHDYPEIAVENRSHNLK